METLIENALNEFTQNVKMVLANLANYLLDGELHKVEDELPENSAEVQNVIFY